MAAAAKAVTDPDLKRPRALSCPDLARTGRSWETGRGCEPDVGGGSGGVGGEGWGGGGSGPPLLRSTLPEPGEVLTCPEVPGGTMF